MSQLGNLKQQVNGIGTAAKASAANLSSFFQQFSTKIGEVQSLIGGAASGADQQAMQSFQAAAKAVQQAVAALEGAAQAANRWTQSA